MPEEVGSLRRIRKIAGHLIVVVCLGFVGYQMVAYMPVLKERLATPGILPVLAGSSAVYAVFFLLLALGWHRLLFHLHSALPVFDSLYIYTRTSIAKYLPGNVGHFVGRNLVASRFGLSHRAVAASSLLEVLCQIAAALSICVWLELPFAMPLPPVVSFLITVLALLAFPVVVLRLLKRKQLEDTDDIAYLPFWRSITLVCIGDAVFFLSGGAILYMLAVNAGIDLPVGMWDFMPVYAVSWFLGLVTPGAPAGVGVREAVMITMLEPALGPADALAIAVLFRIATTVGDILFFGFSFLFQKRAAHARND
ncbi:YbhN family protein [Pseudodesulfovibrio sp. zrk46]|uniref:lysylphosphatidylglycerol synthase transmembrane domain-containing protein n=1 Tax=Pseudodesulfovibrio sp. zrk46 TaxID=2725288 RepID=UPI001448D66C|nr:YbhN family protein [Pseudodesulfovibrio sp. zrk46]QJB55674.1 UPF0104 family protein [Pseudodesulfovibrio sp. zrk46]